MPFFQQCSGSTPSFELTSEGGCWRTQAIDGLELSRQGSAGSALTAARGPARNYHGPPYPPAVTSFLLQLGSSPNHRAKKRLVACRKSGGRQKRRTNRTRQPAKQPLLSTSGFDQARLSGQSNGTTSRRGLSTPPQLNSLSMRIAYTFLAPRDTPPSKNPSRSRGLVGAAYYSPACCAWSVELSSGYSSSTTSRLAAQLPGCQ